MCLTSSSYFVFLLFQLVSQLVQNLERVIELLHLEVQIGLVSLDTHAQEAAILCLAPLDNVLAEVDKLLMSALNLDALVEQGTSHFGQL